MKHYDDGLYTGYHMGEGVIWFQLYQTSDEMISCRHEFYNNHITPSPHVMTCLSNSEIVALGCKDGGIVYIA